MFFSKIKDILHKGFIAAGDFARKHKENTKVRKFCNLVVGVAVFYLLSFLSSFFDLFYVFFSLLSSKILI